MGDVDALSDQEFNNIINELVAERERGLGENNQSDISVLSVRTSELLDFSANGISSRDTDKVGKDAEWTDSVEDEEVDDFISAVGPKKKKKSLGIDAKPVDYFLHLFLVSVIKKVVEQTNLYAEQQRARYFEKTTVAEIRAYIGLLFLMGVIQLPNYRCY